MATVHDVAAYVLHRQGRITAMKLQKLVYYAQAWSLVWEERPLFSERIEAWANGPVVPALYERHRGEFELERWPWGDAETLTGVEREVVDEVLDFYGPRTAQWLSDLTHRERPWIEARVGLGPGERGAREIGVASMMEYYAGIPG
jgi:uncharacterized phage-associated protein